MVSTRHHPKEFPPPTTPSTAITSPNESSKYVVRSPSGPNGGPRKGVHTPSIIVLLWLLISVPLVLWDTGYVLLRPHSMPGGKFHSPIWSLYALYGSVDYVYGWPAFDAGNGFTAAQALLNLFETAAYVIYLAVVYVYGTTATSSGRASTKKVKKNLPWFVFEEKVVPGRIGSLVLLLAFAASVATFSKTILYCRCLAPDLKLYMVDSLLIVITGCNELFSGFANIGHNNLFNLIFLWILPK